MDLQDSTNSDVKSIRAVPGESYPIRLIHTINGLFIIGYVISVLPDAIMMLRPHCVSIDYDNKNDNILSYEFEPYLNQLARYDANSLDPTPFMTATIVSVNVPAAHLASNFENVVSMKAVAVHNEENIKIAIPHFNNNKTVH